MDASRSKSRESRRSRRAPQLEALEGRQLLTAAAASVRIREVASNGAVQLLITGTNKADVIRIDDNGTAQAGNVKVTLGDGSTYTTKQAVAQIAVFGQKGNDQVTYNLTGDLIAARTLVADLGAGADQFVANLAKDVQTSGLADIEAYGGAGNDTMAVIQSGAVTAGTLFPYLQGDAGADTLIYSGTGAVGLTAAVGPGLVGGAGNDTIALGYSGQAAGEILHYLTIDGGAGADTISAMVNLAAGSTGHVGKDATTPAVVQGGDGNDQVRFAVAVDPTATAAVVNAAAIGNAGTDTVRRTANVKGDPSVETDSVLA